MTYASRLRAKQALQNWPPPKPLPGWMFDRMAEEKLMGGFVGKHHPVCDKCNITKSRNGTCYC